MSEHDDQCAVFDWANAMTGQQPALSLLYAIPNGGHRHKRTAAKLKQEGVKAGVPDIHLPIARQGFHGLWLEMKYGKNKPTKSQTAWHKTLRDHGHFVMVCYGSVEAIQALEWYLEIGVSRARD